jgi:hypothetical protein
MHASIQKYKTKIAFRIYGAVREAIHEFGPRIHEYVPALTEKSWHAGFLYLAWSDIRVFGAPIKTGGV